jgi:fermentation-respiration switch protein FrsA (DUF1100 family)
VHALILRRLRAPRLAHHQTPADLGLPAVPLRLPAAAGKSLFAWFVPPPGPDTAVGADLARAGLPAPAVLLVHGLDDEVVPFADARRLHAASAGRARLIAVPAGHDLGPALGPHAPAIVGFLRQSLAA